MPTLNDRVDICLLHPAAPLLHARLLHRLRLDCCAAVAAAAVAVAAAAAAVAAAAEAVAVAVAETVLCCRADMAYLVSLEYCGIGRVVLGY